MVLSFKKEFLADNFSQSFARFLEARKWIFIFKIWFKPTDFS
jgi:hypothetical protein